jgi:hypothetical protein
MSLHRKTSESERIARLIAEMRADAPPPAEQPPAGIEDQFQAPLSGQERPMSGKALRTAALNVIGASLQRHPVRKTIGDAP